MNTYERGSFVDSLWEAPGQVHLQLDDVRIEPGRVMFSDAFEGKQFQQKITIQNCGVNKAFVRVGQPSSFALELSPVLPRGESISPGLILRRTLKYTYAESNAVHYATITYYINDKEVTQRIKVTGLTSILSCDRYYLDFGRIDVGPTPTARSFTLFNTGSKSTRFAVDVRQNGVTLTVHPVKGNIEAHSSVAFAVEAICTDEGKFDNEVWIKSQTPVRIVVAGEARAGNLAICNKNKLVGTNYIVFDFPKTYYGTKSVMRIILKNDSAARGVFCTLANLDGNIVQLDEAERLNPAYRNFQLHPPEGRIGSNEAIIITATFKPDIRTKLAHISNKDDYRFVIYQIKKVSFCKDICESDYPDGLYSMITKVESVDDTVDKNISITAEAEGAKPVSEINDATESAVEEDLLQTMSDSVKTEITLPVSLHGDVELPAVTIYPDEISIGGMKIGEAQTRTIRLKNLSEHLPIFMSYRKVPFIEVKPNFVGLEPRELRIVSVTVTAAKFGTVKSKIAMELLFYDQPRHEFQGYVPVGEASIRIQFTAPAVTTLPKPGKGEKLANSNCLGEYARAKPAIIRTEDRSACPVDKQKSVVAMQPRTYSAMALEKKRKAVEAQYNKTPAEYEVGAKSCQCQGKLRSAMSSHRHEVTSSVICPLTPNQMNNISIEPRHLNIGRVATFSKISKSFRIINRNDVPISVSLVPERHRFAFPAGLHKQIEPQQTSEVAFDFFAECQGVRSFCIRIVVNQNHIYEVTMQAQIVESALHLDADRISFGSGEPLYRYIDVRNILNIPLEFRWDLSNSCCTVNPQKGVVAAGKDMTCSVQFDESRAIPPLQDITLVTERGLRSRVYVVTKTSKLKLELSANTVEFGHVPLNDSVTSCLVLKNDSNIRLEYKVANPTPVDGMTVGPRQGTVPSRGVVIFKIHLQAKKSIEIDTNVNLIFNQSDYLQFRVTGRVQLPRIVIKPAIIHFQKIPTSSFDTAEFTVYNKTNIASTIRFPKKKLNEWRILAKPTDNECVADDVLIEPQGKLKLFIQYAPLNTTNHWFYLPMIINGCVGDIDGLFSLPSRLKLKAMARAHNCVPTVKIFNVAYESAIEISKLRCDFVYYPYNPDKCVVRDQISIMNVSTDPVTFCIRTDELGPIFSLTVASAHVCQVEEGRSIVFTLDADSEIFFTATYHHGQPGRSTGRAQIYVRKDYREDVHNYIIFSGLYKAPVLETEKRVYFGMLPLNIHAQRRLVVRKVYHNALGCSVGCTVAQCDNLAVRLDAGERTANNACVSQDVLTIEYSNTVPERIGGRIALSCSCGCSCEIEVVGCMENSMLTCYGYLHYIVDFGALTISKESSQPEDDLLNIALLEEVSPLPYFPSKLFDNLKIFEEAVTAVEDWVFDFGSCGITRHIVPDSLRYVAPPTQRDVANGTEYEPVVTYMDLLAVVASDQVAGGFLTRCPVEPTARVMALHCLYLNILQFLSSKGGAAPHLSAEFLLDYEEYVVYKTDRGQANDALKMDSFDSISKQSWLDLLLQTLKVFIMARIADRPLMGAGPESEAKSDKLALRHRRNSRDSTETIYRKTVFANQNYFSKEECVLLRWLQCHYDGHIRTLCPSMDHVAPHRFDNFHAALVDSVAVACAIVRYCPYLRDDLVNLYWRPTLAEEYLHNAAKVIQVLGKVRSCFTIYPEQICGGHDVKKLLFVAYLYGLLPALEPTEAIECRANLSQSACVQITVVNHSDTQREYNAILFGNDMNVFEMRRPVYRVAPRKSAVVEVTYHAKFAKLVSCTLLLSGEIRRQRIARSICYKLEGIPNVAFMAGSFASTIEQYSFKYWTIEVQSPYSDMGTYDIYYSNTPPTDAASLNITSVLGKMQGFQICKVNSTVTQLAFDSDGLAQWTFLTMAFTQLEKVVYYYLRNDVIGDFAVRIEVVTKPCKRFEDLLVTMPSDLLKKSCTCLTGPNPNCFRYVKIKIPRISDTIRKFFYDLYCEVSTRTNQNMDLFSSPNGLRIISHLFKARKQESRELIILNDLMTKPITFNVKIIGESRENLKFEKTFQIVHVDTSGTEKMSVHVDGVLKDGLMLQMLSQEKYEYRLYKLKFEEKERYKKIHRL